MKSAENDDVIYKQPLRQKKNLKTHPKLEKKMIIHTFAKEKKKGNRRSYHSSDGDSDKDTRRKVG